MRVIALLGAVGMAACSSGTGMSTGTGGHGLQRFPGRHYGRGPGLDGVG